MYEKRKVEWVRRDERGGEEQASLGETELFERKRERAN